MLAGSGNAKNERGNGVLDIWLGNDVTLQNNSEATMLSKLDEGTDVTLPKMREAAMFWEMDEGSDATLGKNREATMFPKTNEGTDVTLQKNEPGNDASRAVCAREKWGGSFVWNILFDCLMPRKERPSPGMQQKKFKIFEILNLKNFKVKKNGRNFEICKLTKN